MGLFNKKKEEDVEEIVDELEPRKIKDLKPENRKARKEPLKPWGAKERLVVLFTLLITVLTSAFLSLSARNFKLPNLPRLEISFDSIKGLFGEQIIEVGKKGNEVSKQKIETAKKLFKDETDNYSGIYAFYIYDLNGDYFYGLNYQEVMQAASLIKLPVMTAAYKEINKGNLDINVYKPMIEAMGQRSDNGAFNKLTKILGQERINNEIADLGMTNTSIVENMTTPEEVGIFFVKLHRGEILNKKDTQELEKYMTNTIFEEWLKPGLPSNIVLIHKYGRESGTVNDAGVVLSPKPFVMVIMTDGVIEREADELIPKLSKILYDNHVKE